MTVDIRPALPEEMAEFARVVSSSLAMPPEGFGALRPEWTLCAFEEGRLATAYAAWPFTMRMNGVATKVAGVTTVSTNPLYRRRGNLRAIMETDFRRRHAQGEPIAALYASLAAIYQRYGYGIVSTHHGYTVEPRHVQFSAPLEAPGQVRELFREDLPTLIDVYRRFREQRTAYLHRGAAMWQASALAPTAAGETLFIMLYEERGEALGYVVYTTGRSEGKDRGPYQYLRIRDLCWLSPGAYRALWDHLARFDLVYQIMWPQVPADDPLPHLLVEPRMLHDESRDGILARLIDIDRAFCGRGYSGEGGFTFTAIDPLCPWNEGTWELQTSGIETSVTRSSAPADFAAPVSTLSMLLYGQLSTAEAAAMGRLQAEKPGALAGIDALLRTRFRPFCGDHF